LRIRLRRVGRKKQPSYRIVVAESRAPRDGAYLDVVGFYDPRRQPAELRMDLEKVDYWLSRGAELTETARSLVKKARKGGDRSVAVTLVSKAAAAAPAPGAQAEAVAAVAAGEAAAGEAEASGSETSGSEA